MFHYHVTDTQIIADYLRDSGKIVVDSTSLKSLCEFLSIPYENAHDAYADSLLTLKVYKELIQF